MTEKDGTPDTVSLPPTYAPSEAYTESPPPAYRGGAGRGSKAVQVVKLVCVTAVVLTLLTGFFVLSSSYLKNRNAACVCDPRPLDSDAALLHAGILYPPPPPSAQALVGEEKVKEMKENSLDAGDDAVLGDNLPSAVQVEALVEEVMEAEHQLEEEMREVVEEEEKEEEAVLEEILKKAEEDNLKKIRLPVDLILGNPALAGKEVNCEVQRRQVPVAPGILSQTILVTCKDDNDDNNDNDNDNNMPELKNRMPRPPLSLIAPLMKMLTSRPGPQPRLIPISLRGPVPILTQPRNMLQQVPMRSPFPMPVQNKHRMTPIRGPISIAMPRGVSQEGPSDRMLPRHLQPVVRLTPRVLGNAREEGNPMSLLGLQRGALPLPQPRPRAPPRPVSLSPFPPRGLAPFLPFNVLGEGKSPVPATHMEMRSEKHRNPEARHNKPVMDFGPPKGHTLISESRPPTRLITLPRAIRVHTLPRDAVPIAPPPQRYAQQPLRSPVPPKIEKDAEMMPVPPPQNGEHPSSAPSSPSRKHHLLMMN